MKRTFCLVSLFLSLFCTPLVWAEDGPSGSAPGAPGEPLAGASTLTPADASIAPDAVVSPENLRVLEPAPGEKSVGELIRELFSEVSKRASGKSVASSTPTASVPAPQPSPVPAGVTPTTVADSGQAAAVTKPRAPRRRTAPLKPKIEAEGFSASDVGVTSDQVKRILKSIPPAGPRRRKIAEELVKTTEDVKKGTEGADAKAAEVLKKLGEYTYDPYVISGKRLAAAPNRLSSVPGNVSIISKEDLKAQRPKTVQEAMSLLEGVVMYDQIGNGFEHSFGLRGFETGTEVAVYVDGVRYNEPDGGVVNYSLINVDDVESIEVARGAYSSAYGNSAFGGVVNISTIQAAEEKVKPFGYFETGSHTRFYYSAGATGTIPDTVTGMGGDVKHVFSVSRKLGDTNRSNSEVRLTNFLNKWGYEWEDDVAAVNFKINYADNAMSNPGELTVEQFHDNDEISTKPLDGRKFEDLVLQFDTHLRVHEKVNLKLNAYRRVEDIDFTTTSITAFFPTPPNFRSRNVTQLLTTKAVTVSTAYEEEIGFLKNTFEVGVEHRNEHEDDRGRPVDASGLVGNINGDQAVVQTTTGVFIQNTAEFFDRVVGVVGLRHDGVDYDFSDSAVSGVAPEWTFDNTSVQAGTVLKLQEHVDLYGNYSEGFKTPSISELFSVTFAGFGNPELQPEQARGYEVGFRTRKLGPFSGNVDFFQTDLRHEILFDPRVAPFGKNVNLGKSRRYGIEFSTKYKPTEIVEAFFTYTYTKANLRSTLPPSGDLFTEVGTFQSGDDIGLVPRNRFTMGFTVSPHKNLRLHLNGIYTGRQRSQGYEGLGSQPAVFGAPVAGRAVDSFIDGYFLVNGRVAIVWREMEIFLQMSNIFNTEYISRSVTATRFDTSTFASENITFVTPGIGREISFGSRIEFG